MRSTRMIRAAKTSYMILSAVFCAMGAVMLSRPDFSVETIGWLAGAALAAFGIVRIVGFCSRDLYRLAFQHDLAMGLLAVALGLVLMFRRSLAINTLCIVLGIESATDGLFKLQTSLDARRFGLNTWWVMLGFAVIAVAFGVWLVVCPIEGSRTLVQLTGVALLAQGVLNLCVGLCAIKIISHQQPDAVA